MKNITKYGQLSIVISIMALILASSTLYYQFFYKNNALYATVIFDKEKDLFGGNHNNYRIAFLNQGNQYALITDIGLTNEYDKSYKKIAEIDTISNLPLIVKPGEAEVVYIRLKFYPDGDDFDTRGNRKKTISIEHFPITFNCRAMNSHGIEFSSKINAGNVSFVGKSFGKGLRKEVIKIF